VSQGGGFAVREEAEEVWNPSPDVGRKANGPSGVGQEYQSVRVVRPLKDVGIKECAMWAWWSGLTVVGTESLPGSKQGIAGLTKGYIVSFPAYIIDESFTIQILSWG
jgi:cytoplasmic tRNA 2-thiolation protein 2